MKLIDAFVEDVNRFNQAVSKYIGNSVDIYGKMYGLTLIGVCKTLLDSYEKTVNKIEENKHDPFKGLEETLLKSEDKLMEEELIDCKHSNIHCEWKEDKIVSKQCMNCRKVLDINFSPFD